MAATLRYDTLTRQYHVARAIDGRTEKADVITREDVAWSWLTRRLLPPVPFPRCSRSSPTPSTYVRVRANASPRGASFIWPWEGDDAVGFAKFTFMR